MDAFHSNWTAPFSRKNPGRPYEIEDFELLTTIISALKWQEYNGSIQMITDKTGMEYYRALGLESLWDRGISDELEGKIDPKINPDTFWAAGKFYALAMQKTPSVMLDTDFIVWKDLRNILKQHDVTVIHREELDPWVYPSQQALKVKADYHYPSGWDWKQLPCNTAFTGFNNVEFKNYYISEAIRFMQAVSGQDPLIYMVFAEQRLLSMCAREKNVDLFTFSNTHDLFHSHQTTFTHVWGHKRYLRSHKEERTRFCRRCMARVKKDYPKFYPKLLKIEGLKRYQ